MFGHIFINRCKCLVRDKEIMFWTLMFPVILASLFWLAFANLPGEERFGTINIAVVNNPEYMRNHAFQAALAAVSDARSSNSTKLFRVQLASHQQAEKLLRNNQVAGYILFANGDHLIVKESGINQSIIKEFLDDYHQRSSAITTISSANPSVLPELMADAAQNRNYLREVSPTRAAPNTVLNYYYALIAMACLFGSFWGMKEVAAVQADISPQGARVNLAPVHKLKIFGYSLCAAAAVHMVSIFLLVAYLSWVIKVDFGSDLLYIAIACIAGSLTGVSFGALIGALVKKGEPVKVAVLISVSLILSFLSGLMLVDMKYTVTHAFPFMAYINPANLITDAFYSLYYYDTYNRFFTNVGLLLGFTIVFYSIVYLVLRRQRYASI